MKKTAAHRGRKTTVAPRTPSDLARALRDTPGAWDRWRALPSSHRREHVSAIDEAKKPDTRARRVEAAVRMVSAGPINARGRARAAHAPTAAADPPSAPRYVLLLRGVNVGTGNSLPMAELRSMLAGAGCARVETYIQSGNAAFETNRAPGDVIRSIETALEVFMGRRIATTLRTLGEMRATMFARPSWSRDADPRQLCVTFLSHAPSTAELAPLRARDWSPERYEVIGREIVTWHPMGQGKSPLAATLAKLPVRGAATTRNWNTVEKLVELVSPSEPPRP